MPDFKNDNLINKKDDLEIGNDNIDQDEKNHFEDKKTELAEKTKDIDRYKDQEGLTIKKMDLGLWLVTHRKQLKLIPIIILILISALTWPIFIFTFIHYAIVGIRNDNKQLQELTETNLIGHEYFLKLAPKDLTYSISGIIKLGDRRYDFFTEVKNVNDRHWGEINYSFNVSGNEIGHNTDFILPGETKYLTALNQELKAQPSSAVLRINSIAWFRLDKHEFPDWEKFRDEHLKDIEISDIEFTPGKETMLTEKLILNDLKFNVSNDTAFNYRDVTLSMFLKRQGKIIGINKYILNTLKSSITEEIDITWPGRVGRVDSVAITPEINIIRDDVYIKFEGGIGEEK